MSTYTRPLTANLGAAHTGLAGTLGYTVKSVTGTTLIARTTAGVTEDGTSGIYYAAATGFDYAWSGRILWDAGAGTLAAEEFLATGLPSSDGSEGTPSVLAPVRTLTYTLRHYGVGGVAASVAVDAGTAFLTLSQASVDVFGPVEALITPATSATSHVLSYILPDLATVPNGTYNERWDWEEDGVAKSATVTGVVITSGDDFTSLYAWAQKRLQQEDLTAFYAAYPGYALEAGSVVTGLLQRFPCVGTSYSALSGADKAAFDEGAGLLLAGRLRLARLYGTGQGPIASEKIDTAETTYRAALPGQKTIEQTWADDALAALFRISCIRAANLAARDLPGLSVFGVAGRTRARQTQYPYLLRGNLYDLVLDAGLAYNWWGRK